MRQFVRRIWHLLRRRQFEADLAEEIAFHRDMAVREHEGAGRRMGNVTLAADRARDVWMPAGLRDMSCDIHFACRLFLKDRWFTAVAVVTLAVSIGFNVTLFAIVSGMWNIPPVDHPDRIVVL